MTTLETVKEIVADQSCAFGPVEPDIKDSTRLVEDLGFDSLDTTEVMMALEDRFNIQIEDEEIEPVETFAQLVQLIERKKEAR